MASPTEAVGGQLPDDLVKELSTHPKYLVGQGVYESWKIYDEDGNVIEETLGASTTEPDVDVTTALETEDVCL